MKVIIDEAAIDEVLERGVVDCIEKAHLKKRMMSGERLRIKLGIDPTSPHLHLGHTVPLRKLRQFQDLGHQAVLIIGDATAMIGDPTGRTEARKQLSRQDIDENKKTYVEQAAKVLNIDELEIRHNGEWFDKMSAAEFLSLTSLVTVAQVLQREDFKKRVDDEEHPLTTLEMTYPVMQGYDSVMIKSDVELGGHDQLLNVLMGRRLQRRFSQPEQDVLTVPLVEGTDGVRKMSKSFGNAIFLEAAPDDMFGQVMSVPDNAIIPYFTLITDVPFAKVKEAEKRLADNENPRNIKAELAWTIVRMYHGEVAAEGAKKAFDARFSEGALPDEIPEFAVREGMPLADVLVSSGLLKSKSEARRQVEQGGVKVDGEVAQDFMAIVKPGSVIQKGKRFFVRLI